MGWLVRIDKRCRALRVRCNPSLPASSMWLLASVTAWMPISRRARRRVWFVQRRGCCVVPPARHGPKGASRFPTTWWAPCQSWRAEAICSAVGRATRRTGIRSPSNTKTAPFACGGRLVVGRVEVESRLGGSRKRRGESGRGVEGVKVEVGRVAGESAVKDRQVCRRNERRRGPSSVID